MVEAINKSSHLSVDREFNLLKQYQYSTDNIRDEIRELLVKKHMGFIIYCTKKYFSILGKKPAINIGCIGFIIALDKIDLTRGTKLTTVSKFWIMREIHTALRHKYKGAIPISDLEDTTSENTMLDVLKANESGKESFNTIPYNNLNSKLDLNKCIDKYLDKKSAYIIKSYYGLEGICPKTLQELGQELEVTREWVRQIIVKARNRLKLYLTSYE